MPFEYRHIERQSDQPLAEIIVQIARDPSTFVVLCLEQLLREPLELFSLFLED